MQCRSPYSVQLHHVCVCYYFCQSAHNIYLHIICGHCFHTAISIVGGVDGELSNCCFVRLYNSSPTVTIYTMDALLYAMQVECKCQFPAHNFT